MTDLPTTLLIKVEAGVNSNKFYELALDVVHTRWGRVDDYESGGGQRKDLAGGQKALDKKANEKRRKGYTDVDTLGAPKASTKASAEVLKRASLKSLCKPDFVDDKRISDVIDTIAELNAHNIATASGGKITVSDGTLRTALGVINTPSLDAADKLLIDMAAALKSGGKPVDLLEKYLTLVPQAFGRKRGWENHFLDPAVLAEQADFVKQLRDSLEFLKTTQAGASDDPEVGFRFKMGVVEPDDPRFTQVADAFARSMNRNHPSRRYKLKGLYDITDTDEHLTTYKELSATLGNERWMWHGTQASNVLSILASGLYVPPANAGFVTGRMFGNGVYMSKQSTKSLNYSGGVWAGNKLADRAFMFSLTALLGESYHPKTYGGNWTPIHKKYNSIDVAPNTAGVANHECIVWNTEQINLRYLCDFAL